MAVGFLLILLALTVATFPIDHPPAGSLLVRTAGPLEDSYAPDPKLENDDTNKPVGWKPMDTANADLNPTEYPVPEGELASDTKGKNNTIGSNTNSTTNADRNQTVALILPKLELTSSTQGMNNIISFNANSTTNDDRNQSVALFLPKLELTSNTQGLNNTISFNTNSNTNANRNQPLALFLPKLELTSNPKGMNHTISFNTNSTSGVRN